MQNMNAMGISNETLRAAIKHIERLANREALGSLFEVYLFELKSVTVRRSAGHCQELPVIDRATICSC